MSQHPVPIDLETTGLHPADDAILEFAMLLVDRDLKLISSFGSRVVHASEAKLARMNDYVREMHTSNGLLDEVRASSLTLADVDEEAATWLFGQGVGTPSGEPGIILGSSCRLDLYMIELQMPKLASLLSHRMIDVSGFRETLALYAPEVELPKAANKTAAPFGAHRALSDIGQTLIEAHQQRAAVCHQLQSQDDSSSSHS
ncbi:oligoribonuclease [Streptomyces sp. NPDC052042]|uniref:oligoribonuclease n=1 Tax=Streptomyces sp. NPDC052042 TaxID=3365683 RepID=UPI0037D027D1